MSVIDSQLVGVKLFGTILPKQMEECQKKDNQLSVVYEFVAGNRKPKLLEIHRIRSKPIRHLLSQYGLSLFNMGSSALPDFSGMTIKFSNLFFLASCVVMSLKHFMMTMVIKVCSMF